MLGLIDYEKAFCPDIKSGADIYDIRGINRDTGCVIIVRPDQYIAQILPLTSYEALAAFFDDVMLRKV